MRPSTSTSFKGTRIMDTCRILGKIWCLRSRARVVSRARFSRNYSNAIRTPPSLKLPIESAGAFSDMNSCRWFAANPANRGKALEACPSLDQIAIYTTDVLIADLLMNKGVRPDLLLGHSFGELAALAVARRVLPSRTGLKIVCQRCIALEPLRATGKMAAVSCGQDQAARLIQASGGKTLPNRGGEPRSANCDLPAMPSS